MTDLIKYDTEYSSKLGDLNVVTAGKDLGRDANADVLIGGKTSIFVPNINSSKWNNAGF